MIDHPGISEGQVGELGDARSLQAVAEQRRGAWCRGGCQEQMPNNIVIEDVRGSVVHIAVVEKQLHTTMGTPFQLLFLT